jgi:hypothetical protein
MDRGKSLISISSLIISLVTLALVAYLLFDSKTGPDAVNIQIEKNLAGELADNNLYRASIEEYNRILAEPVLDNATRANINYLIARIYFENLFDYENAAAHYVRARSLNPDGSFYDEAGKNLIFSLEKMGRVIDAKRELDRTVNIDSVRAGEKGKIVVARVGDSPIFLSDIDAEIQNLPPEAQKKYLDKKGKMEILQQFVGMELMYRDALREGMEKNSELLRRQKNLEKQLVVEKYIREKILPQVNIDTSDVRNFYLANKKERYGDKPYDDIKASVLMDYQQEKSQQAFSDYIAKLAAVEKVQILEENVR